MARVVFDTVVFVRSLINPHSLSGRVVFEYSDRYELVLSEPVVTEILEVLQRPEMTGKFSSLRKINMAAVLSLLEQAILVDVADVARISRDPKDDMFLATAKAAGAKYLVSQDKDLLDLIEYEDIRIVDGAAFLALLQEGGR